MSTIDNIIVISEIIRRNRKLGRKTYIVYGDAVRCFYKLWLRDALIELYKAGCDPHGIQIIYLINENTDINVVTPCVATKNQKNVKQGTVLAPTLCSVVTDQINKIGEDKERCIGDQIVGILVFVNDVMSAGTAEDARKIIRNFRAMEKLKKFMYG